jgi:hypothetical protein
MSGGIMAGSVMSTRTVADKAALTRLLDRLVLALVVVLSCLPFSQVVIIPVGGVTLFAYDLVYIALVVVLLVKMATHRLLHPAPFFLLVAAVAVSTAFALAGPRAPSLHLMLYQGRYFLPFAAAALIVATGTTIPFRRLLLALCAGSLISASLALAINYLFPGFLVRQFSFAQEISELAVTQGRLHWTNDSLAFMPFLAAATIPMLKNRALGLLLAVSGAVAAGVSFSRLNRTVLAGLGLYVIVLLAGSLLRGRTVRQPGLQAPRVAARLLLVLAVLGAMIYALVSYNPELAKTAGERFPTNAEKVSAFLQGDVAQERGPIWRHYLQYPPLDYVFGQGLGTPLVVSDRLVYTSDVSYWAFLLVFGILGLLALAALLSVLFRRLHSPVLARPPNSWALTALVIVTMLIALNVDWLSRDNMVVYLSLLVMSATQAAGGSRAAAARKPAGRETTHA